MQTEMSNYYFMKEYLIEPPQLPSKEGVDAWHWG